MSGRRYKKLTPLVLSEEQQNELDELTRYLNETLDLPVGTEVRFKDLYGRTDIDASDLNWTYGRVTGISPDKSIKLVQTKGVGGIRNIRPENLYKVTRGPRGGKHWIAVVQKKKRKKKK
jgi:hypothetical protein